MAATEDCVFSVNAAVLRGLFLQAGFCEAYLTTADLIIPLHAFRRTRIHVELGIIDCREDWTPPRGMKRGDYRLVQHPRQSWMHVEVKDLLAAATLCGRVRVSLPADGHSRRFG